MRGSTGLLPKKYVELSNDGQVKSGHEKKDVFNPPSGLSATPISPTTIMLSWNAPKSAIDIEDYTISFAPEGTRDTSIRKVPAPGQCLWTRQCNMR